MREDIIYTYIPTYIFYIHMCMYVYTERGLIEYIKNSNKSIKKLDEGSQRHKLLVIR